jgi:uncharacterized iron-regulated protein
MKTIIAIFLGVVLLPPAQARADKPPTARQDLKAMLRKLEKDITAVRGLKFKSPVVARIISRPKGTAKKTQGYYSIKDKTVYLYDDIKGAYERGVLIHEMVHALQDQHFGLAKLHQTSFDSDAEMALAALIEGDATFTMIEVLKNEQPRVAAMLNTPLEKAKNLTNAFIYAQGARYVKALKEHGGWKAVDSAYYFPPRSTAAVLHPRGVEAINLGPGKTRGEFALIRMLAENSQTAALAFPVAAGWRADRAVEKGPLKSWEIAFGSDEQAFRCQSALAKLRVAQNPRLKSTVAEAGANVWHGPQGSVLAVLAHGDRVWVVEAPDKAAYQRLLDRLEGPLALTIYSKKDKRTISFGQLVDRLVEADLVCIGETHDSEPHHRVQLQIIKALYACDGRLGVGMEMFQRPFQKEIDRYLRGEIKEREFLKNTDCRRRWGFAWSLYRPIVEFCRRNDIPLAALNAPQEITKKISRAGFAELSEDEKKQLGSIDFHLKEHRDYWFGRLAKMHGKGKASEAEKERFYQVMTVWDEYMGASAARFQKERRLRRMVVLAGSGHIDRGFGIPARAAKRTGGKAATVRIELEGDLKKVAADPVADFIILVK